MIDPNILRVAMDRAKENSQLDKTWGRPFETKYPFIYPSSFPKAPQKAMIRLAPPHTQYNPDGYVQQVGHSICHDASVNQFGRPTNASQFKCSVPGPCFGHDVLSYLADHVQKIPANVRDGLSHLSPETQWYFVIFTNLAPHQIPRDDGSGKSSTKWGPDLLPDGKLHGAILVVDTNSTFFESLSGLLSADPNLPHHTMGRNMNVVRAQKYKLEICTGACPVPGYEDLIKDYPKVNELAFSRVKAMSYGEQETAMAGAWYWSTIKPFVEAVRNRPQAYSDMGINAPVAPPMSVPQLQIPQFKMPPLAVPITVHTPPAYDDDIPF